MEVLRVKDLSMGFQHSTSSVLLQALYHINFQLNKGEILAIVGESGSGKSLTSHSILRLLPPYARFTFDSQILFNNTDLLSIPEAQMQALRGSKIAMIFQEPMTVFNPVLTIGQQLLEVTKLHNKDSLSIPVILEEVGLQPARMINAYPHELSGGMKQRISIAMALLAEPDILIADEPTSALDVSTQAQLMDLFKKIQKKRNLTIIFITHDLLLIKKIANRIVVLYAGLDVEKAEVNDFFVKPLHPYSKQLLHCVPKFENPQDRLSVICGHVPSLSELIEGCRFASRCPIAQPICFEQKPTEQSFKPEHKVKCWAYDSAWQQSFQDKLAQLDKQNQLRAVRDQKKTIEQADIPILEVKELSINFPLKKRQLWRLKQENFTAVQDVSFKLYMGKTLALVGESGCGKTTTSKAILGLIPITQGDILISHEPIKNFSKKQWQALRKKVQIVFQDPYSSMNPRMQILDIIAEGIKQLKILSSTRQIEKEVEQLLEQVGLPKHSLRRYPHEFSGGQRQRIAIARALAVQPELLILDEPTSALDVSVQAQILNLFKDLQAERNLAYLFISHNLAAVRYLADEVVIMKSGKIVESGPIATIFQSPKEAYTKELLRLASTDFTDESII